MNGAAKPALLAVQLAGIVLSALLVIVTYASPGQVEERLQRFAIEEVEEAADAAWSAAEQAAGGGRADRLLALSERLGLEARQTEAERRRIVPALLANAVSERCVENCEFWVVAAAVADSAMVSRIADLKVGQGTLRDFVVERYETSVQGLIRDLRRFGLVNLIALSLAMALVILQNRLNWRFAALSVGVTAYTAWAAYGYYARQDWAMTILLQDWAAPGYQVAMIFVSCLMADWLFLRGAVSRFVVNAIASVLPG